MLTSPIFWTLYLNMALKLAKEVPIKTLNLNSWRNLLHKKHLQSCLLPSNQTHRWKDFQATTPTHKLTMVCTVWRAAYIQYCQSYATNLARVFAKQNEHDQRKRPLQTLPRHSNPISQELFLNRSIKQHTENSNKYILRWNHWSPYWTAKSRHWLLVWGHHDHYSEITLFHSWHFFDSVGTIFSLHQQWDLEPACTAPANRNQHEL